MFDDKDFKVKVGLAEMLKGGVIMDITTVDQAKIAEDAGAVAVMALERVPADIRKEGGVARMADPTMIAKVKEAVKVILEEFFRVKKELITKEEIQRAKTFYEGRTKIQMENSDFLASFFAREAMFSKKILTPLEKIEKIKKVSGIEAEDLGQFIEVWGNWILIFGEWDKNQEEHWELTCSYCPRTLYFEVNGKKVWAKINILESKEGFVTFLRIFVDGEKQSQGFAFLKRCFQVLVKKKNIKDT